MVVLTGHDHLFKVSASENEKSVLVCVCVRVRIYVCVCVCANAIYIVRGHGGVIDSSNGTNLFRDRRDLSSRLKVEGYYCGFVRIELKTFSL